MNQENIYSSVPETAFAIVKAMNYNKPIEIFLKNNKGRFYTAKQIAEELGYPTRGTQVEVRKAITILLTVYKVPIISTAKGFSYARTSHQMRFYADRLADRLQGLERRIKAAREVAVIMEGEHE